MSAPAIAILVNGQPRQVADGTTVSGLLQDLGLAGKPVAVERNRQVIPRVQHGSTILVDGDHVELVTFVGGG